MKEIFYAHRDYLVVAGHLYFPLLYDPEIAAATNLTSASGNLFRGNADGPSILRNHSGSTFIKSLQLSSLLENYPKIFPESLQNLRSSLLQKYTGAAEALRIIRWDKTFESILFQILPHFVRRNKLAKRQHWSEEQVLDWLNETVSVPFVYFEYAAKLLTSPPLGNALKQLPELAAERRHGLPADGLHTGKALQDWLLQELEKQVLSGMKEDVMRASRGHQALKGRSVKHVALLLCLMDMGSFELGGFGFYRIGSGSAYAIFKHTGEYALQDYYGRIYLFPDCRVAVFTDGPLRPVVLERYKHPFLPGFAAGQEICLGNQTVANDFSPRNAIEAIETGIGALFYGYNSRLRNGYHSLDSINMYVRGVNFDDYRVAKDHRKIVTAEVEIKNAYF